MEYYLILYFSCKCTGRFDAYAINDSYSVGKALIKQLFDVENAEILNSITGTTFKIQSETELLNLRQRLINIYSGGYRGSSAGVPQEILDINKTILESESALERVNVLKKLFENDDISNHISPTKEDKTDKWKEEFDSLYANLQYRRDKDKINSKQYYDELDGLNKKYFDNKSEYLSEYRQYELKLYKLQRDMPTERIADLEHEVSILDKKEGSEQEQIGIYKKIQDELHTQAEYSRSLGLTKNNDYLQELQKQWISYADIVSNYTLEQDRLMAAQILGANWEKEVLSGRLSTFKTFRDDYISIIEELARKQEQLNNLKNNSSSSSESSNSSSKSNSSSSSGNNSIATATIPGVGTVQIAKKIVGFYIINY